jgi:hypothetical protein
MDLEKAIADAEEKKAQWETAFRDIQRSAKRAIEALLQLQGQRILVEDNAWETRMALHEMSSEAEGSRE